MNVGRLFRVLVVGAGALVSGACATTSGATPSSSEAQTLPDGGVAPAPTPPPTIQPSYAPSGW